MGARSTVYNEGLTQNWDQVLPENKQLLRDFVEYLITTDHSSKTCYQYEQQLKIYMCFIERELGNKHFTEIKKKELIKFFGALQGRYKQSPNRISSFKSVISSMSNYIETILDEDYPTFRNPTKGLKLGGKQNIRPKTVLEEADVQRGLKNLVADGKTEVACFLAFLAFSGSRRSEAIQVYVKDFTDETLVLQNKYWLTHSMRTKGAGSAGKILRKYVEVSGFKPYLELWLKDREKLGINCPYLFTVFRGGKFVPAQDTTANSWAQVISRAIGLEFYNHCCRHFYTTRARRNGVPDTVIQKMVGWASSELINVYDDREDEEELEEYFANLEREGGWNG